MDAKLIATWVGIATGMTAVVTFFMSINQRKKELRWKQAELARKLIDDLFANDDAAQGFYMLDGVQYPYKDFFNQPIIVFPNDVIKAINNTFAGTGLNPKDARIMFCVDTLLYFLNRIENSLKSKLIVFEDIKTPCDYYVSIIATNRSLFISYMHSIGYVELLQFCERFPSWAIQNETTD